MSEKRRKSHNKEEHIENSLAALSGFYFENSFAVNNTLKRLFDSTKYTNNVIETLAVQTKSIGELGNSLKKITIPVESLNKLNEAFNTLQKNIAGDFSGLLDELGRFVKEWDLGDDVFLESGWWYSPSVLEMPATDIDKAITSYRNGNKNAITRMMLHYYSAENFVALNDLVNCWGDSPYFAKWSNVINDALFAHKKKKYTLSIPALLLVIEGVAGTICKNNDLGVRPDSSDGKQKVKSALTHLLSEDIDSNLLNMDIILNALDERIYAHTSKISKARGYRHFLNRHAILHGNAPHYGTPKNSIQCFLLLDLLLRGSQKTN